MSRDLCAVQKMLPYWRAALAETSLLHPEVAADSRPITLTGAGTAWRVAAAHPDVSSWTAAQFDAAKTRPGDRPPDTLPFVLVPARLSTEVSHGVKHEAASLHQGPSVLCIPCLLDRSGRLAADPGRHPWIPRDMLEPTLRAAAIGRLEDADRFLAQLPAQARSFDDLLHLAADLFAAVTGARLPSLPMASGHDKLPLFTLDGHELVAEWHGLPCEPPVVPAHLIRLYDRILHDAPPLPLLERLAGPGGMPARPPTGGVDAAPFHARTVGHISDRHALSPSQREAMVELARLEPGGVLAVNGPPGTGKTTLLQSVVAQLWVDAAVEDGDCPLIVVTSTNVKAVENVLDSFATICAQTGHRRWHPYARGFGLFLASGSRETAHPACTARSHPFADHETPEGVSIAERHFLDEAAREFGREPGSVAEAVRTLHRQLVALDTALRQIVAARHEVFRATGHPPTEGALSACTRWLRHHHAQVEAARSEARAAGDEENACHTASRDVEHDEAAVGQAIDHAERRWNTHLATSPWWLDLLAFIPGVRRRRDARDRDFLMSQALTARLRHRHDDFAAHFERLRNASLARKAEAQAALAMRLATAKDRKRKALAAVKAAEQAWADIKNAELRWREALKDGPDDLLDVSLVAMNDRLDLAVRARMFRVADWYWSGRWLLEMAQRRATGETDTKGRVRLEAKYRRFAKLSPCLVSNFHMAPSFFTAWQAEDMPFWNTIDLLVVDEAGQVAPEVGAPMFALARRALVVGDVHQIEPVWNTGECTDRANAVRFGLVDHLHDPRYEDLVDAGRSSASGSLMRVANGACEVQKFDEVRGLMLTEHRRCVPELIDYCNRLIYGGRLQPERPALARAHRVLPAFGYHDVSGRDRQVGGSRQNPDEARAIVAWLKAHRERIEQHYRDDDGFPTPLWKLVGVVTPFAAQAGAIERELRRALPDLVRKDSRLTVGTVHALQGAERAVVIFSPTYGDTSHGDAFFDRTPNMLNVAVSRAKDSFIVIGNLARFDPDRPGRPSGLLASYLFDRGEPLDDWPADAVPSARRAFLASA